MIEPADSELPQRPPIAILGVPFDNITTGETVVRIRQMIESRKPHYLVTANVDFVVQAQNDIELRRIFADADLVLCDGTPLVWVSRLLGNPLVERVAGADVVPLLIEQAAKRCHRLFFLGATAESAKAAVQRLQQRFPDLIIAGHYSPPFNALLEMNHEEIKRRISEAAPDLLLVAFGCPKAEKWIAMHYRELAVPVVVGVGATIDFLAGQVKRAPVWMRRGGLEWMFRLMQEPRRLFGRYAKDLWVFGWSILGQYWCLFLRPPRLPLPRPRLTEAPNAPGLGAGPSYQHAELRGNLEFSSTEHASALLENVISDGRSCILDLSQVAMIDSTGLALLMRLQQRLQTNGASLILLGTGSWLRRIFKRSHWDDFFACAPDLPSAINLLEARTREKDPVVSGLLQPGKRLFWRGEITAANIAEVWEPTQALLLSQVERNGAVTGTASAQLVIDLSQVRFIDSSGLGLMVRARKMAQRQGIALVFTGLQPAVRSVVRMARLEEFLKVQPARATPILEVSLSPAPI